MPKEEFDIRELPSWKYFAWGLLNGLILGIVIKHGVDVSEVGILSQILEAFKPLFEQVNLSTTWISLSIFLLGLIGTLSFIYEIVIIYKKGWIQRIIALSGFLTFLFLVIGFDTSGIIFMIGGIILVLIFPEE